MWYAARFSAWFCAMFTMCAAGCQPAPARLRVVPIPGCYIQKDYTHTKTAKVCTFAVKGWRATPAQRQQLDSLAAQAVVQMEKEGRYYYCTVNYLQYDDDINEHTKHTDDNDSSLLLQGIRVAYYPWNRTGEYYRFVYDASGDLLRGQEAGQPSVVVNAKLEIVANPTKQ